MDKPNQSLFNLDNLTPYFREIVSEKLSALPIDLQELMIKQSEAMSAVGVKTGEEHKIFMYTVMHTPTIASTLTGRELPSEEIAKISNLVYKNREEFPINTIFNFYKAVHNSLNKLNIPIKDSSVNEGVTDLEFTGKRFCGLLLLRTQRRIL